MKVTINGKGIALEAQMSIAGFLRSKGINEALVAVEHNRQWVRREDWDAVTIAENDRLEIIRIMAGG